MTQASAWGFPLSGPISPSDAASQADESFDAALTTHRGASRPSYAEAGTVWADSASEMLNYFDGASDFVIPKKVEVPASATSTGFVGQWAVETGFVYYCVATDTWERVAIATW